MEVRGTVITDFIRGITEYLRRLADYDLSVTAIQIVLIALVVWLVMRFLRGSRGARLFKGAVVMLAVIFFIIQLLPRRAEWQRIEFLFARFLWFGAFAFIVAFQPELRRVLISIGQARVFKGRHIAVAGFVDELIKSLTYLSDNRIGAIIAIERSMGLGGLVGTGKAINADVTAELLNTIFYPGTALHDMGVIIHEGRIAAAGCQFPMAESEEVDPSLGSRHRAALGVAKDSDAIVLVVSEESGRIALAYDGQIQVGFDIENVHEVLFVLLNVPRKRAKAPATGAV